MTKYAILVGCNFKGTANELAGCIPDVERMERHLVQKCGYDSDNVVKLTDDVAFLAAWFKRKQVPTKSHVLQVIDDTVSRLGCGDTLFFHVSSHGTSVADENGDEADSVDEILVVAKNGLIVDDELHAHLVAKLPPGAKLRAVIDTCHSGTMLDLPYVYGGVRDQSSCAEGNKPSEAVEASKANTTPEPQLEPEPQPESDHNPEPASRAVLETEPDVVSISGCTDEGFSADTVDAAGVPAGALTMTLLDVLEDCQHESDWFCLRWIDLVKSVRARLRRNGYSQVPQLAFARRGLEKAPVDY